MKATVVTAAIAHAVAYPHIVIAVLLLIGGLIRNPGAVLISAAVVAALLLACRIMLPRLSRAVIAAQRAWARAVLGAWRVWADRRALKESTRTIRSTVVSEAQPLRDLGKESS